MIQRIALLIGGLGAAAVLAFALGLFNFAVAWPWNTATTANVTSASDSQQVALAANGADKSGAQNAQQQTKTVVDKVYVAPAPTKANQPATNRANQPTAQSTAPRSARTNNSGSYYSESESESEGSGGHHDGDD